MNSPRKNPIDNVRVYICAGLLSACGALLLNVMPVLFGAIGETLGYGEQQLGTLALASNLAFALVGVISLAWLGVFSWRTIAAVATVIVTLGIAAILNKPSYGELLVIMAVAGGATGALYALAMVIFGGSDRPERAFGFKLGMESIPGAALLILLPVAVAPQWGFEGILIALAASALLMGLALFGVPSRAVKREDLIAASIHADAGKHQFIVWMSLVASLVFMTGVMAVWPFLELIGKKTGLSSNEIGTVLSVGFLINAIGGFIASSLGLNLGRVMPVAAIVAIVLVGLVIIGQFTSMTTFTVGTLLFLLSINFVLAYTFGLMAEFDTSGKLVALGTVCVSLGAAFGPAIAGSLIERYDYPAALIFSGVCAVLTLAIHAGLSMRATALQQGAAQSRLVPMP